MEPVQLLILGGAFVLGAYAGFETKIKRQNDLALVLLAAVAVYVAAPFILNIFQFGQTVFMGITMTLMLKSVILGTSCMLIYNSLR